MSGQFSKLVEFTRSTFSEWTWDFTCFLTKTESNLKNKYRNIWMNACMDDQAHSDPSLVLDQVCFRFTVAFFWRSLCFISAAGATWENQVSTESDVFTVTKSLWRKNRPEQQRLCRFTFFLIPRKKKRKRIQVSEGNFISFIKISWFSCSLKPYLIKTLLSHYEPAILCVRILIKWYVQTILQNTWRSMLFHSHQLECDYIIKTSAHKGKHGENMMLN